MTDAELGSMTDDCYRIFDPVKRHSAILSALRSVRDASAPQPLPDEELNTAVKKSTDRLIAAFPAEPSREIPTPDNDVSALFASSKDWFVVANKLSAMLATERAAREKSDTFREELRAKFNDLIDAKNEWQARAESAEALAQKRLEWGVGEADKCCAAQTELARAEAKLLCDVCCGKPLPSGRTCICGGTGNIADAATKLREMVYDLEKQLQAQPMADELAGLLEDVLTLVDSGWLVRDISKDSEPGWAIKQMKPLAMLKEAREVLARFDAAKTL